MVQIKSKVRSPPIKESHGTRLIFEAVIEQRLSATGLFGRKDQFHTKPLQQVGHILEGGCVKLVAKTGEEELGFWHGH